MKTFKELQNQVIEWGKERNLYCPENGATILTQTQKFFEEFGELNKALLKKDYTFIKDGIGDSQVCLIAIAELSGVRIDLIERSKEEAIKYYNRNKTIYLSCSQEERDSALLGFLLDISREVQFDLEQCFITLEIIACIFGFQQFECLEYAYNEIKDRKGKMINRAFVKNE